MTHVTCHLLFVIPLLEGISRSRALWVPSARYPWVSSGPYLSWITVICVSSCIHSSDYSVIKQTLSIYSITTSGLQTLCRKNPYSFPFVRVQETAQCSRWTERESRTQDTGLEGEHPARWVEMGAPRGENRGGGGHQRSSEVGMSWSLWTRIPMRSRVCQTKLFGEWNNRKAVFIWWMGNDGKSLIYFGHVTGPIWWVC